MHRRPPVAPRRGAVLIITVLLTMVAATITLLVLRQTLISTVSAERAMVYDNADETLAALRAETELQLRSAPYGWMAAVQDNEPDRMCPHTGMSVTAGSAWDCGANWEYPVLPTEGTWVQYAPPTAADPTLRITYRGTNPDVALTVSYLPSDVGVFTAMSTGGTLNTATFGTSRPVLGGLYASGDLTVDPAHTLTASTTVATSSDVIGSTGTANVYTPNTIPTVDDLGTPGPDSVLTDSIDVLQTIACPTHDPVMFLGGSETTHVCVDAGSPVMLTNGNLATVPANAEVVAFAKSGSGVGLWYRTSAPDVAIHSSSSVPATRGDAFGRVIGGSFGGQYSAWQLLGNITMPRSGLVGVKLPLWVGLCGASGFTSGFMNVTSGTCQVTNLPDGTTIVAGTAAEPVDVWMSGPLSGDRLGVLASGQIVWPWFASTVPTATNTELNHVSQAAAGGFTSWPDNLIATSTPISFTGLARAPQLQFGRDPFTPDSGFTPDPSLVFTPPAWYPGNWIRWSAVSEQTS